MQDFSTFNSDIIDRSVITNVAVSTPAPSSAFRNLFLAGFLLGAGTCTIYLLSGGSTFLGVHPWAEVAFYPGFVTGYYAYDLVGYNAALTAGCISVGLFYGLVAVVLFRIFRRKKPATH